MKRLRGYINDDGLRIAHGCCVSRMRRRGGNYYLRLCRVETLANIIHWMLR